MKRAIPVFVVLVALLSVLLYIRLRAQALEAQRPAGGSATVEGVEVDVVSRIPSRILTITAREGDTVKKGQVLVTLDCAGNRALLARAKAALQGTKVAANAAQTQEKLSKVGIRSAKTQIWMARAAAKAAAAQRQALAVERGIAYRTQSRLKKVHQIGGISDQAFDQTQSKVLGIDRKLQALQANMEAARARAVTASTARQAAQIKTQLALLSMKGALVKVQAAEAAVASVRVVVKECTLRAPRAGIVLTRNFEPGEVVLPGSRVLTLVDTRVARATFYLPNAELRHAKPGRTIQIKADAYDDKTFAGSIRRVGVEAEFTPRNVQTREDRDRLVYAIEVEIPNPKGLLRPGMPVEISIPGTGRAR